ncbi:unknown [Clostridium sp. CAG:448]|nr:unknown [Clostridium sp. CAG:448]
MNSFCTRRVFCAPILKPTIGMHPAAMPMTTEITIWKNFITMPTTAMGICAYCSCPNTGSCAPYLRSMLLIAAIAATREICARKLHSPSDTTRPMMRARGRNAVLSSRMLLGRHR